MIILPNCQQLFYTDSTIELLTPIYVSIQYNINWKITTHSGLWWNAEQYWLFDFIDNVDSRGSVLLEII